MRSAPKTPAKSRAKKTPPRKSVAAAPRAGTPAATSRARTPATPAPVAVERTAPGNRLLWIILGSLVVLDVVLGVMVIAR